MPGKLSMPFFTSFTYASNSGLVNQMDDIEEGSSMAMEVDAR